MWDVTAEPEDRVVMMGFLSFELKLALLASNYSCNHNVQ